MGLRAYRPWGSPLSASQLLSRRQSLSLAAWAILGAGCTVRHSDQRGASTQPGAPGPSGASPPAAAPPPPVVPPEFAGLSDPVALRFYQRRGWRSAWDPGQSDVLARGLGEARRHGLEHVDFKPKMTPGAASVQPDIRLTLTALRYAKALASGHVEPRTIEKVFTLQRNDVDLAAGLEQALAGGGLADWLASLPPSDAEYKALSAAYALGSACQAAPAVTPDKTPPPPETPPSQSAPSAIPPPASPPAASPAPESPPALQNPPAPPTPPAPLTPPAQGAPPANTPAEGAPSGSAPPGDASTTTEPKPAGVRSAERIRQLAANLERRRWLARTPPATRIDVNTAGCFLAYVKPGADPWAARVVLGKPGHETPSIQASFHRLVANPPWRVPVDIARKEIFPKGRGYLRREHMRVIGGQVVQQPGPHNSLGLVKFDVQDPYAIYLHDTPSKSLFALPDRHKSHGCVRVQNAVGFARKLADERGRAEAFDKALASGKTREVDIGEAISVRLLYHTAYADDAGRVTVIADAYGWNDKLAAALGFPAAPPPAPGERPDVDLGP
jgi:L,D-transpeptidase YcbB